MVLYAVLESSARILQSFRGEYGLVVCAFVVIAAVIIEMLLPAANAPHLSAAIRALGLRTPARSAMRAALVAAATLILLMWLYGAVTDTAITLRSDWLWLAGGMLAQGGVAEEVVFRGFLFRHLRLTRTFWNAAAVAAIPFVIVHSVLFLTLDFAVALSSLLLALLISFPLAWLFERAGNSIWPPAIVHAVIQGAIKVAETEPARFQGLALFWMGASATLPMFFFLLRPSHLAPPRQVDVHS